MSRTRILQIFSKYLRYGGEEGSVHRIGAGMQEFFDIESFVSSTADLLDVSRLKLVKQVYRNSGVLKEIEAKQRANPYDAWQIHNVFPAISPGIYTLAEKMNVPIIHYLHNYRMGCANGFMFTKGRECQKCISGNYVHGALGSCWRDSMSQSTMMALMLADVRRRGLFQQVERWIAISEAQKEIHVRMGIPADRITVIEHFFEVSPGEEISVPTEDKYALFIGRLSPEKGVDQLLDAWATVPSHRRLVIAGDGPDAAALQKKAQTMRLENVEFAGFVKPEEQKSLWDGAAFSIVPSVWQEPFGMVVLEAWARRRPVVANRIGALTEIISPGEDGFLARAYDAEDLSHTIETAFCSDLKAVGLRGHSNLANRYGKERWQKQIREVYSAL